MSLSENPSQEQKFQHARSRLMRQANTSIREIVAFGEIAANISNENYKTIEEWMESNLRFMDADAINGFRETLDKIEEAARKAKEYIKENKSGVFPVDIPGKEARAAFSNFMLIAGLQPLNPADITSRAFLIAAESSFEVLFGQLAHAIYAKNPAALPKSEYSFTLEEMSNYSSIDDARDALIVRKIEGLLRESPDEWNKWLKRTVGISMDQIMSDWPQTREIFIRRNMLVHTDGNITERYLVEVKRAGGNTQGLEVGQSLVPSLKYLRSALQRMIALETLLISKAVSHIDKDSGDKMGSWLAGNLDLVAHKGMWDAACLIANSFDGTHCRRDIGLEVTIGGWLAHKNRDGIDCIRDSVNAWDISGLSEEYEVTKKLLLDQLSAEELSALLERKIFTRFEVFTNPLFANVSHEVNPTDGTRGVSQETQRDD
jgi:hypothetical protein